MTTRSYTLLALLLATVVAASAYRLHRDNQPVPPDPAEAAALESSSYSLVEPNLYVGGRTQKPPPGTTAVLSLSYTQDLYTAEVHRYSSIPDGKPAPSLEWLQKQVEFVDAQQKAGRQTYIHCDAGMSRGPMVTTAYLMYHHHWSRDKALKFLEEKRPLVRPNIYFMDLLLDWEQKQNPGH